MKKERKFLGKLLNIILCLLLALTILPVTASTLLAAGEGQEYVSLPITIRDYADDGMLFDYSDYNSGKELTKTWGNDENTSIVPTKIFTANTSGSLFTATNQDGFIRYTSTGSGIYITYAISGVTRTQARYALLKYKTSTTVSSESPEIGHRWDGGGTSDYRTYSKDGYGKEDFVHQIIDLGSGSETLSYITLRPKLESGQYIDIAYLALFSSQDDAKNYIAGKTYNMGNNLHYGFLMGNPSTIDYNANGALNGGDNDSKGSADVHMNSYLGNAMTNTSTAPSFTSTTSSEYTALVHKNSWNAAGLEVELENKAKETLLAGRTRIGLVEPILGANKEIVYKQDTVDYLAWLLEKTLTVKEIGDNGYYNFNYVMGQELAELGGKDLATVFRESITGGTGNYTDSKNKFNAGGLNKANQVTTYYDAAYFLLHNIFITNDGYGKELNNPYTELQMVKKTDANGKEYYIFNSGYNNTIYDNVNGIIYNSQTETAPGDNPSWGYGLPIYDNKFDPVKTDGYGITGSDYVDITGANADQYAKINYNLSLEGHAQFIYYHDSDMYFTFTGDDDVYLFINGKLVLDLGGGHSISKMSINLNDVADLCELEDGEAYDFDFYYMERHGYAANFSIETNIRIVDPSMVTTKKGYQNGGEVGYNGYVNEQQPITYEFGLQNNGESDITNLVFDDPILGVSLSKDAIKLNSETKITDIIVTKYNTGGTVEYARTMASEDELRAILADILKVKERIVIYGINYTVPSNKWVNNAFPNTVYTKAISTGENTSTKELSGVADYVVQKQDYHFDPLHYYDWGTINTDATPYGTFVGKSQSVTATKAELLAPVDAQIDFKNTTQTIKLCSASGNTSANINKNVTLNADGSITYQGTKTGADSYYYLVEDGNAKYGPVRVDVYVYGVADNVFVLDYGLAVELNDSDSSFVLNDVVSLATANPYGTEFGITGIDASADTNKYGFFTSNNPSLIYKPNRIMNDDDTVTVSISVLEVGASEVTKTTGVTMTQEVKVAPASVMYYEDNFEGLTYVGSDGNKWLLYETVDENGNLTTGTMQDADQDSNYGSDPNYDPDKQGTLTLDTEGLTAEEIAAAQASLAGDASNGTLHAMKVGKTAEILNFEFDGTGFEILSRTTSEDYAVLNVTVTDTKGTADVSDDNVVYDFPVITECINGDLYQVPVIAATDMPYSTYKVALKAARSKTKIRMVYIDGVRIYGALEGKTIQIGSDTVSKEDAYYSDDEKNAKSTEIKRLIDDGKVAYAYVGTDETDMPSLLSGTTLVEDREEDGLVLTTAENVDEYMTFGPNNELYMDSDFSSVIAFYLVPDTSVYEANRTVQIGAHRKSDYANSMAEQVNLVYGDSAEAVLAEDALAYEIKTGTEQYYTIDMDKLTPDTYGRYLVIVGSTYGENVVNTLALTNLKVSGYTVTAVESELIKSAETQDLFYSPMLLQVTSFRMLRARPVTPDVDEVVKPEVDVEDTVVENAGTKVPTVSKPLEDIVEKEEILEDSTIVEDDKDVVVESEDSVEENTASAMLDNGGMLTGLISFLFVAAIFLVGAIWKKTKEQH